jgi:type VI secretion system secreted protein Hcp
MNADASRPLTLLTRNRTISLAVFVAAALLAVMIFTFVSSSTSHEAGATLSPKTGIPAGAVYSLSIPGTGGGPAAGIPGEGSPAHPNSGIEILSFSWGMSNSGSAAVKGGSGAGKVNVQDLSFTKKIDIASPNLFQMCATGGNLGTTYLYLDVPASGASSTGQTEYKTYGTYTMSNTRVASCSQSGDNSNDRPTESISFTFQKITFDYVSATGATGHFGWNKVNNQSI